MDRRTVLPAGTRISFPGMECEIEYTVGKGSNAIVYKGKYYDGLNRSLCHHVLIKEMFPYHPKGLISRGDSGDICVLPGGEDVFDLHKYSFECGNEVHLRLLERYPDRIGANLNSFAQNGTMFTVMGYDGGRSIDSEYKNGAKNLRDAALLMLDILDAVDVFHSSGYLHLDISPDNILRVGEGKHARTYLIDYNSVHDINTLREGKSLYCSTKEGYTAPEVRQGNLATVGYSSDVYSVSAVFYWLLMGKAPTAYQLMCKNPPDAHDSRLLNGMPETVSLMVRQILRRGLAGVVSKRYASAEMMRADLLELIDRIDGIGITHSALWEAGQRNVSRLIRQNPAMHYIADESALYPMRAISADGAVTTVESAITESLSSGGSVVLRAAGGMGKTTALLHTAITMGARYSSQKPVFLYVSLYDWNDSGEFFIRNRILEDLRFGRDVSGMEDARHRLNQLFDKPITTKNGDIPAYVLLIDGLNEAAGDTESLKRELDTLSKMGGVSLCCTTRSDALSLDIPVYEMSPLTVQDISDALSTRGLLLPEQKEMQELLSTPLMLSIFIRTADNTGKQTPYNSDSELIEAYFDSLCEKETDGLPENAPEKWMADAAVRFVLPAICGEIARKKGSLDEREMLAVVERCWRVFGSKSMSKLFPRWIGHSKDIRGDAKHSEEWYGEIVVRLLRYRMGLIVRDSAGTYRAVHQYIEEYLLTLDRENKKKLKSRRVRYTIFAACCAVTVVVASVFIWNRYIRPQPYDEDFAHSVMEGAVIAHMNTGGEIDTMRSLLQSEGTDYRIYRSNLLSRLSQHTMLCDAELIGSAEWAENALTRMTETGKVMPWSREKFNETAYAELFSYSESCVEEYSYYLDVLDFLENNPSYNERYGTSFRDKLLSLVEADAAVSDALFKLVISPHLSAMEDDDPQNYKYYIEAIGAWSDISDAEPDKCDTSALETLMSRRRDKLVELSSSEVFTIYERMKEKE